MANKKKNSPKKKKGLFPIFLLLVFLISLGACAYLFYGEVDKELSIKDMEDDIQTFVSIKSSNDSNNQNMDEDEFDNDDLATEAEPSYSFDWDGLLAQSEYVIGWIQVPGIDRINYPIVQHPDDNQFFLKHDWKGNSQSAGAIFLNRYNAPDFTDMNSIVYGHRMKAGSMFGMLKNYEKQEFLNDHPYFYIYTPDGRKRTYEIVCCSKVKDGSDAYLMHFESPSERLAYYEMMLHNAVTQREVEVNRFDTTVMLSTCGAAGSDYFSRVVILGKLVEINVESELTNAVVE